MTHIFAFKKAKLRSGAVSNFYLWRCKTKEVKNDV